MDLSKSPDVHEHLWACVQTDFRAVLSEFLDSAHWNFETFAELAKNKYLTLFYNWVGVPQGRGDQDRLKQYETVIQLVLKTAKQVWLESVHNIEPKTENSSPNLSPENLLVMNSSVEIKRMIGGLFLIWIMHQNQPTAPSNRFNIKLDAEDWKKIAKFEADVKQFKFDLVGEKTQEVKNQINIIWLQLKGQGALDFANCPSPDMFGADEDTVRHVKTRSFLADNPVVQSVDPGMNKLICAPANKLRAKFKRMDGKLGKSDKLRSKLMTTGQQNTISPQCSQTDADVDSVAQSTKSLSVSGAKLRGKKLTSERVISNMKTQIQGGPTALECSDIPATANKLKSDSDTMTTVKATMAEIEMLLRDMKKQPRPDALGVVESESKSESKISKAETERARKKKETKPRKVRPKSPEKPAFKDENYQKLLEIAKSLAKMGEGGAPLSEKALQQFRELQKEPAVDEGNQAATSNPSSQLDKDEGVGIPEPTNSQQNPQSPPSSPLTLRIENALAKACASFGKNASMQKKGKGGK